MHAAFAAFFCLFFKKFGGSQPVHAIMKVDNHSGCNAKVTNHQYDNGYLFHEQNKDKRITG
jgi:hypothetical protein